jgi:hypothetical protein
LIPSRFARCAATAILLQGWLYLLTLQTSPKT